VPGEDHTASSAWLGEKGNLIGGVCRARMGIEAANIGSERGTGLKSPSVRTIW
jgi:uncharacterized protein (DUF342 family)